MRYVVGLLLAVVLASCEETLPEFDVTMVTLKAEWKNSDLHLSPDADLASGVEILEQGFVLELPVCNPGGYWMDYPDIREKRTVKVPAGTAQYTFPSEGWKEGLSCSVYAYVKTGSGNFRSSVMELKTPVPPEVEFTGVVHQPDASGPWYGGGTLVIEGNNFHGASARVYVDGYELGVVEGSPGRIVARYGGSMWNQAGEYPVRVNVAGRDYDLSQKMVMEGIQILSIEPERPRYGELVKMYLRKPVPGNILQIGTNFWEVNPEVVEDTDEYVTFRMPEYPADKFEFTLLDQFAVRSQPFTIKVEPSWMEVALDPAIWDGQSLDVNSQAYHQGKSYFSNADHTALMVFDPVAAGWQKVAYPDIPNREWAFHQVKLCGWGDWLYMYACIIRDSSVEGGFARWQYLYRLGLKTGQWELLGEGEVTDSAQAYVAMDLVATEEGVIYLLEEGFNPDSYTKLMEYRLEDKVWKESAYSLYGNLVGSRGNKVYWESGGDFYSADIGKGSQPERVLDLEYSVYNAVVADDCLYYNYDEDVMCRLRLDQPGAQEERLGVVVYEGSKLTIPGADRLYCIVQPWNGSAKFYQYIAE